MAVATCRCGQGCFAIGRVCEQFRMCWFRSSVCPSRNNPRTKPVCLRYQSSHAEYRFGRSRSSGFPVCFRLRHWCGCVPAPRVRRNPGRCRDRYICRPVGLPAADDCRPKRSGFLLRGRLKLLRFSDGTFRWCWAISWPFSL